MSTVQAVAIFQHSFSGTVVGAIGECPLSKNPKNKFTFVMTAGPSLKSFFSSAV